MSHEGAWRCCYLFCRNQEAFQGHLSYFEESQPGSIYSEHNQMKTAMPLLGKQPGFSIRQHLFICELHSVVGFGNPNKPDCHRESYFVK